MLMFQDRNMTVHRNDYARRWEVRFPQKNGTLCLVHVWDDQVAVTQTDVKEEVRAKIEALSLGIVKAIKTWIPRRIA